MRFEWDPKKARINVEKHGIDFRDATEIFYNNPLVVDTRSGPHGEQRRKAFGLVAGQWITVVFTRRGAAIRIISARPASRAERREHRALRPPPRRSR